MCMVKNNIQVEPGFRDEKAGSKAGKSQNFAYFVMLLDVTDCDDVAG